VHMIKTYQEWDDTIALSDFERDSLYVNLSSVRGRCLSTHSDILLLYAVEVNE